MNKCLTILALTSFVQFSHALPIVFDENTSVINYEINNDVNIINNVASTKATEITITPTGKINGNVVLNTNGYNNPVSLNMVGGTVQGSILNQNKLKSVSLTDVEIGGMVALWDVNRFSMGGDSHIGGSLDVIGNNTLYGPKLATISGGHVEGRTIISGSSYVEISGGTFGNKLIIEESINTVISGGTFESEVSLAKYGSYEIHGGNFKGGLSGGSDWSSLSIYGGLFDPDYIFSFYQSDTISSNVNELNIYGSGLSWENGLLSGQLQNGDWLSVELDFDSENTLNLIEVPVAQVPSNGGLPLLALMLVSFIASRIKVIS